MGKWIFLSIAIMVFASCIHINRSAESGYPSQKMESANPRTADWRSLTPTQLSKILAELGMNLNDLNTTDGLHKVTKALEIKNYESLLTDERERKQYYKSLPWLKNEEEQLEFLEQNGYYARQAWLRKKSVGKRSTEIDPQVEELIAAKDITVGMPNEIVRRSWGNPDTVDVAGNPIYGNERWRYKRYTPSPEGYHLQSRIVYFEAGKVVGWEQIDH